MLGKCLQVSSGEWKIWFEAVMMEIRNGNFSEAFDCIDQALQLHQSTGRLWAALIQLNHIQAKTGEDFKKTFNCFKQALQEIPKSGEVWCEGARVFS